MKTDCTGNEFFTIDNAYADFMLPEDEQQGLIYCYCNQQFEKYGTRSLGILFEDGEQYCKEWYTVYVSQNFINYILALWIALVNWSI